MMVERLFLAVPWDCLRFVIVAFPDHTHYFYNKDFNLDELVEAIQLSHDSATGPDEMHLIVFGLLVNFQMIGNMQQLFLFPNLVKTLRNQIIIDL